MLDITHHPCHLPQPKSWSKSCNVHNTAWWLWRPRAICGKYGTKARAKVAFQDPTFWIWIGNSPGVATSFNNPRVRTTSVTLFEGGLLIHPFFTNQPTSTNLTQSNTTVNHNDSLPFVVHAEELDASLGHSSHHPSAAPSATARHQEALAVPGGPNRFFDVEKAPHKKMRQILPLNNAFFENHGLMLLDHTEKKTIFQSFLFCWG